MAVAAVEDAPEVFGGGGWETRREAFAFTAEADREELELEEELWLLDGTRMCIRVEDPLGLKLDVEDARFDVEWEAGVPSECGLERATGA